MTVREALTTAREALSDVENSRLEASWLVARAANVTPSQLLSMEEKEIDSKWLAQALRRRSEGEPLAYILGERGFFKHMFKVRPGVLIPRPETELIVETALRMFSDPPKLIADFGCGSGCIGLSLLHEWKHARLMAIDSSDVAVETTRENADRLGVLSRTELILKKISDVRFEAKPDLIVANPPYIDLSDPRIEANVRNYEPAEALFAPQDGLEAIFEWSECAMKALRSEGLFVLEIGAGQQLAVEDRLTRIGFVNVQSERDLSGHMRVVRGRK